MLSVLIKPEANLMQSACKLILKRAAFLIFVLGFVFVQKAHAETKGWYWFLNKRGVATSASAKTTAAGTETQPTASTTQDGSSPSTTTQKTTVGLTTTAGIGGSQNSSSSNTLSTIY